MKYVKGPGFPDRLRDPAGSAGDQAISRDRPRQHESARQGGRRGAQGRSRADRHHRDSLQREPRDAGGAHRRPGERQGPHRHQRDPRRVGRKHARRHRAEARRQSQGRHQQSLQAHRAGNLLRGQHAGDRSRPAEAAAAQGSDHQAYIEHRREVILRRTRFELRKAEERAETLEGYLIALANLDEFIRIIRGSREPRRSAGSNCSRSSSRGSRSSRSAS